MLLLVDKNGKITTNQRVQYMTQPNGSIQVPEMNKVGSTLDKNN